MKNNVSVPISPGELIDKITILEIKKEFIKDTEKLVNINLEYKLLENVFTLEIAHNDKINLLRKELKEVNLKLWKIEDEIRDLERNKIFNKEFIKLARSVYFTNDERSEIKKNINLVLGSSLLEEKSYSDY